MGEFRRKYDEEFKKNAVKLSYASPRTVKELAEDLGIHENLLYNWRRKYTALRLKSTGLSAALNIEALC